MTENPWRQIKNMPRYEINRFGSLRVIETGAILYAFKEHGMEHQILHTDDGIVAVLAEQLVAETFPEIGIVAEPYTPPVKDVNNLTKMTFLVVTEQGFPHGLACMDCERTIEIGQPYRNRLNGMFTDGIPLTDLICVYC